MRVGTAANAISKLRYRTGCPDLKCIAMDYETGISEDDNATFKDSRINNNFGLSYEAFPADSLSDMGLWDQSWHFNVHVQAYSPYYSFATIRYEARHKGIEEDYVCE